MQQRNPFGDDQKDFVRKLLDPGVPLRVTVDSFLVFEQDYERIRKGLYRKPWDMYYSNRQMSPIRLLQQTSRVVQETMGMYGRINGGSDEDKAVAFFGGTTGKANSSLFYPDYYQTAFHFQTDGWMSKRSADVYDDMTETLFQGMQDAMQRTCIPELVQFSKDRKAKTTKKLKVLEIACGTGRLMSFVRDNLPLDTQYTAVDLSPFYLEKAREMDAHWRSVREREDRTKGNTNGRIAPANTVQALAEDLPFADGEFDAILIVNLFHEIPREVRAKVAAQVGRVCRPGGKVVFSDSVSLGDRPAMDAEETYATFNQLNEPFYTDYVNDDISSHFEKAGLLCSKKLVAALSKTLTFDMPERMHSEDLKP